MSDTNKSLSFFNEYFDKFAYGLASGPGYGLELGGGTGWGYSSGCGSITSLGWLRISGTGSGWSSCSGCELGTGWTSSYDFFVLGTDSWCSTSLPIMYWG